MKLQETERDLIKRAYQSLHDSFHNLNCMYEFISSEFPRMEDKLEYSIFLIAILRQRETEVMLDQSIDFPVFGKELALVDLDKIKSLVKRKLNTNKYGILEDDLTLTIHQI